MRNSVLSFTRPCTSIVQLSSMIWYVYIFLIFRMGWDSVSPRPRLPSSARHVCDYKSSSFRICYFGATDFLIFRNLAYCSALARLMHFQAARYRIPFPDIRLRVRPLLLTFHLYITPQIIHHPNKSPRAPVDRYTMRFDSPNHFRSLTNAAKHL